MEKQTVEIWLAVNETGDAAVSLEGAVKRSRLWPAITRAPWFAPSR
jgi:hypothetical protein